MAVDPKYARVKFASICCDELDGAREIIQEPEEERWQNISHYFMAHEHKEIAKKVLGFRQVPFYVVLDEQGKIQQMGSSKTVDFDDIPGVARPKGETPKINQHHGRQDAHNQQKGGVEVAQVQTQPVDRVFEIDDDLDFWV